MTSLIKYPLVIGLVDIYNRYRNRLFNQDRESVHIIGNGWASYYFVKYINKNKYIPIVISPNDLVLDTTKLIDSIDNNSINPYLPKINCVHIKDSVDRIDPDMKIISTKNNLNIKYKNLVIAIGSEVNDYGIKGINEYTLKIKNVDDIDNLRRRLTDISDNKMSKRICVIGGGPTGVELAFKLNNLGHKIVLIEGMGNILNGFDRTTINEITKKLDKSGIKLKTSSLVKMVNSNNILTNNKMINYDIAIWTGGVQFNGFGQSKLYNSLKDNCIISSRGINVNKDFSIGKFNNIFGLGDVTANCGPPTAQNAKNQAKWLSKYFNNNFDYEKTGKYEVEELGKLIHTDDSVYIESKYYSGYLCKYVNTIIDLIYKM